jgi:hypothetical protein
MQALSVSTVRGWLADHDPDAVGLEAVDRSGEPLFNSFPIRYFDEGTRRVRRPEAGGLSERPRPIVTPRVRTR